MKYKEFTNDIKKILPFVMTKNYMVIAKIVSFFI